MNILLVILVISVLCVSVLINIVDTVIDGGETLYNSIHADRKEVSVSSLSVLRFIKDTT